jgi:hypothetical protein
MKLCFFLLAGATCALGSSACTPIVTTKPTAPIGAVSPESLHATVSFIGMSPDMLDGRPDPDKSRLVVAVTITNRGEDVARIDLTAARLHLREGDGAHFLASRPPVASGEGPLPSSITDDMELAAFKLQPDETRHVWLGFPGDGPEDDAPLHAELELGSLRMAIADPGTSRVKWKTRGPVGATYIGSLGTRLLPAKNDQHELSTSLFATTTRFEIGPTVLSLQSYLAVRTSGKTSCCTFGSAASLGVPIDVGKTTSLSPYAGIEGNFGLGKENATAFFGPTAGVQLGLGRFAQPASSYPLSRERTRLRPFTLTMGYVHWFGDTPAEGVPGLAVTAEYGFVF